MIFHFWQSGYSDYDYFRNGYFGVEFFFIISGYFMAENAARHSNEAISIWRENIKFIIKKVKKFFIPCLIMQSLGFVLNHLLMNPISIKGVIVDFIAFPFDILLLRQWGFNFNYYMGITWYLSAMVLVMFICYPLLLKYKEKYTLYIAPIATLFILGCFSHIDGKISNTGAYWGIIYKSTLRGFAVINLGVIVHTLANYFKKFEFKVSGKICLLFIEVLSLAIPVFYSISQTALNLEFECLFFLGLGIIVSFIHTTLLDCFLDRFSYILDKIGEFSLYLFLAHYPILGYIIPELKNNLSKDGLFIIYIVIVVLVSFILMFINNAINEDDWKKIKSFWIK